MLDTAIIGGGLSGLVLARSLARAGRDVAVFEARARLGGRILTATAPSGLALDLGPAWFWPENQPLISGLIAVLGLAHLPQHDQDTVLHLRDPDKTPEPVLDRSVHGDARRLADGVGALVTAVAADLPPEALHLGHVLTAVAERGDHVALTFTVGAEQVTLDARHVVLALPPRLLAETVQFTPDLDAATREAMDGAVTWMAAQAKVVIAYDQPVWRTNGYAGNAFVTHEQAVLGEIYDACDATGTKAALGGFLALTPELRDSFAVGLAVLMENQMEQVFGVGIGAGTQQYQDWAHEPFTCSARDRAAPAAEHVDQGNPLLRRALWEGKLYLGGSETAARGAGYLEGALEAARRVDRALAREPAPAPAPDRPAATPEARNAARMARFSAWVATQGDAALDDYRRRLTASLAAQQRDQLTQRAVLESAEAVFARALDLLDDLAFETGTVAVEKGRSALMPAVQKPFGGFLQALMDDVVAFNRNSCALSNFPAEHKPSKDYLQATLRDIAAAWQEFSLAANRHLLAAGPRPRAQRTGQPAAPVAPPALL